MEPALQETEEYIPLVVSDILGFTPGESAPEAARESSGTKKNYKADTSRGNPINPKNTTVKKGRKGSSRMPRLSSEELAESENQARQGGVDAASQDEEIEHQAASDEEENDEDEEVVLTDPFADEEEEVEEQKPTPKKRGRPPKKRTAPAPSKAPSASSSVTATPEPRAAEEKKGLKRLAKKKLAEALTTTKRQTRSSTGSIPAKRGTDDEDANPPPGPKRRGRPPKAQKVTTATKINGGKATKATKTKQAAAPADDTGEEEDQEQDETEYVVECIVDSVIDSEGVHWYRVKWKGYPESQNTWEPKLNLGNCKAAVSKFENGKLNKHQREHKA